MTQNPSASVAFPASRSQLLELTEDDIRRVAQCGRGQRPAFDLVVSRYGDKLNTHALYILRDAEEAHDVVQEVFIKAMREPRFFDADFKMQAWLYRVTRNLCFNLVRDGRRRRVLLHGQRASEAVDADPVEAVFAGERQKEIKDALELLTADHETILMLRYYDDLSYAEIADRLRIPLGTVMSRLSRARDRLLAVMVGDAAMRAAS